MGQSEIDRSFARLGVQSCRPSTPAGKLRVPETASPAVSFSNWAVAATTARDGESCTTPPSKKICHLDHLGVAAPLSPQHFKNQPFH